MKGIAQQGQTPWRTRFAANLNVSAAAKFTASDNFENIPAICDGAKCQKFANASCNCLGIGNCHKKHVWTYGQIHNKTMANWEIRYGWNTADIQLTDGWHAADIRRTYGGHTADIRQIYGRKLKFWSSYKKQQWYPYNKNQNQFGRISAVYSAYASRISVVYIGRIASS